MQNSPPLYFAPLEGITDACYREAVLETCPGWSVLSCDFLRVPAAGNYPLKHLREHAGERFLKPQLQASDPQLLFQILASEKSLLAPLLSGLQTLNIDWVDFNIGCPSKTVCKHGGGASLLLDLKLLERMVSEIRSLHAGKFSCKIRIGYHNGSAFAETLAMLEAQKVDLITVHARTREQLYKEPADWSWIAKAVELTKVPIVGNGDVWCPQDALEMTRQTGCAAVMVARGAMKAPWFPGLLTGEIPNSPIAIYEKIEIFFQCYNSKLITQGITERGLVRQLKSLTRYMFDDLPFGRELRSHILRLHHSQAIMAKIQEAKFACHLLNQKTKTDALSPTELSL
jgi:tRNA-dihydrouridine synthase